MSSRYVEIRRARSTAHGMRKRVLISNDYTNNCLITTDCSRKFLRLRRPPVSQSVGMGSGILGSRTPSTTLRIPSGHFCHNAPMDGVRSDRPDEGLTLASQIFIEEIGERLLSLLKAGAPDHVAAP